MGRYEDQKNYYIVKIRKLETFKRFKKRFERVEELCRLRFEGKGEEPDLKEELCSQAMKGVDYGLETEGPVALSSIMEEEGRRLGKWEHSIS
ncbi:hypothetical protein FNV43_RR00377 [Rhamnella rubrinervis]|uniref:Uncharacterized protein n=1 Tax=Rhamnella rubrinervis TaxID=2594499 RepID=A0A8K0MSC3_9ROSA|nr:hypothetical protein FNV43_RR00377 [Rhamnella rubrinervis]